MYKRQGRGRAAPPPEPAAAEPEPAPGVDPMSSLTSTERDLLRLLHEELAARERGPGRRNGHANGAGEISPPDLAG